MKKNVCSRVICILLLFSISCFAQKDPLNSPMWNDVKKMFLKDEAFVFDSKNIIIKVPSFADNPLQVPVYVDASYYKNASRLILFADLNAIIPIVDMQLFDFKAIISLNMKIAQGTPLRAAIKDKNGLWHIASSQIKSFGGGCSVASEASTLADKESQFGKYKINTFELENGNRIKLSIYHPMDTGLFIGNPEFFINEIKISKENKTIALLKTYASISENPRLIFETLNSSQEYKIQINDTDGNEFIIKTKGLK